MVCPTLPSELQELVMADWYEALHKRMHKRKYELCMRFFMSGAVQNIVTHWEYWNECSWPATTVPGPVCEQLLNSYPWSEVQSFMLELAPLWWVFGPHIQHGLVREWMAAERIRLLGL